MKQEIKLFENRNVRTVWDEDAEEWYFSVVDVVGALTESVDAAAYWRKLKQRLKEEGNETVTNCHALKMLAADGKMRMTDLLFGENNELENRHLRIKYQNTADTQSAKLVENENSKGKICTLNCTLEEHLVLEFLKDKPKATQKEIAAYIHKSERTVKTIIANLQTKNLLVRVNGKRNGFWKVIINDAENGTD